MESTTNWILMEKIYDGIFKPNEKDPKGYVPWKITPPTGPFAPPPTSSKTTEVREREDRMMAYVASIKESLSTQKGLRFNFDIDDLDVAPDPCPYNLP
ncbi:unnamed protein product [Vicia faba]|uniref:Uncharacterized protein n=1 Tax=Vicia faba TaxID=3906 RepID=A0AAV0ZAC0_VICFA|nr:unnamed protein product [Vicia faba]